MEDFEENMLATCNFYDAERQEITQLQTEWINIVNFREMDQYYKELKPLIDSISEFDFANPYTNRENTWPYFEIYDDGKGPLTIIFLFRNKLTTYNPDGSVNEMDGDSEYVYPLVIARVYDIDETYYEPIGNDMHLWIKEKYELMLKKAGLPEE
jgi:hypothetical protein